MPRAPLFVLPLLAAAAAAAPPADQPADPPAELNLAPRWSASAELTLWRPAFQDDIALPGAPALLAEDLNLDEPELTPALAVTLTDGDWRVEVGGFIFGTDTSRSAPDAFTLGGVSVPAGAPYSAELDYGALEILVTRRVWSRTLSDEISLALDAGGGLRASDLSVDIASGGAADSGDQTWVDALAAARLAVELPRDFDFDIHAEAGGGLNSFTASIGTSIRWQPEPWIGAQLGYRFIATSIDDDGFEYEGAIAGLYAGLSFEF